LRTTLRKCCFRLFVGYSLILASHGQTAPAPATSDTKTSTTSVPSSSTPSLRDQSWGILQTGVKDTNSSRRASAVRVLSLLRGEPKATIMASRALDDPKPVVRTAAAMALGELHATSAIPKLKKTLSDKETPVVLAASHSLLTLKDKDGYEVYYAILMGDRKGEGLVAGQLATLKDPKKLAALSFREGIGFIPYADIGYTAFRTIAKDGSVPLRIASAKALIDDPDPLAEDALIQTALSDKSELVRAAALEALVQRGHPTVAGKIALALSDDKDSVRFTAAATIVHLTGIADRKLPTAKTRPSGSPNK
jgi:HEAT repeat protein